MYLEGEGRGGEGVYSIMVRSLDRLQLVNISVEWVLLKCEQIVREENLIQAMHDAPVDR